MWETLDSESRDVALHETRWSQVLLRHPNLGVGPEVVLDAVARPDARIPGRRPAEEWYYRRGAGPSAWIRVVVHYERDRGSIVAAFPRRWFP